MSLKLSSEDPNSLIGLVEELCNKKGIYKAADIETMFSVINSIIVGDHYVYLGEYYLRQTSGIKIYDYETKIRYNLESEYVYILNILSELHTHLNGRAKLEKTAFGMLEKLLKTLYKVYEDISIDPEIIPVTEYIINNWDNVIYVINSVRKTYNSKNEPIVVLSPETEEDDSQVLIHSGLLTQSYYSSDDTISMPEDFYTPKDIAFHLEEDYTELIVDIIKTSSLNLKTSEIFLISQIRALTISNPNIFQKLSKRRLCEFPDSLLYGGCSQALNSYLSSADEFEDSGTTIGIDLAYLSFRAHLQEFEKRGYDLGFKITRAGQKNDPIMNLMKDYVFFFFE